MRLNVIVFDKKAFDNNQAKVKALLETVGDYLNNNDLSDKDFAAKKTDIYMDLKAANVLLNELNK